MMTRKINILIFTTSFIPSVVICVLRPLIKLEKLGEVSLRINPGTIKPLSSIDIKWCDVALFCRNIEYSDLQNLYALKQSNKKIIYDIDDNFEEIPLNTELGIYHRTPHRLHVLSRFYAFSDIIRVYSARMKHLAARYHANTHLVKSYFDADLIENLSKLKTSRTIKIAYPTTRIDDPRLEEIFYEAIRQILIKYPNQIEVHLWGEAIPDQLQSMKNIVLHQNMNNYEAFIRSFYTQNYDIGLAPLLDEPFFHSKTNTKYRDFGGCEVAGIYSNVLPYTPCISHKKSGILVQNTVKDWVRGLSMLIDNPALRKNITQTAKKDVLENYSFDATVKSYRQSIHAAIKNTSRPIPWAYAANTPLIASYVISSASQKSFPKESDLKFELFTAALNYFKGQFVEKPQTQHEFLLNINAAKKYNMVCYLVRNNTDFVNFKTLFPYCRSSILDLSLFDDSPITFNQLYLEAHFNHPVSFILNDAQAELHAIAKTHQIPFVSTLNNQDNPEHYFTLKSDPVAYLNIIEQHIQFAHIPNQTPQIIKILSQQINKIKKLWLYLQWRVNRRIL